MALNAYLTVEGETQGMIEGSATRAGVEGMMEVNGWTHEVSAERDPASGLPTGKRQHKPITMTKPIDKATPLLMRALTNNENLPSVVLRVFQVDDDGSEAQTYVVELLNATVVNVRAEQLNNKYPENTVHEVREHVSFTYERIVWDHEAGGVSSSDDWAART